MIEHRVDLILRKAASGDEPGIKKMIFSILESYGLKPDPDETDADLHDIEQSYYRRGGVFYVLEDRGIIIGSTGISPTDEETCELRKMYLSPNYRGLGIGKVLMERSIRMALELGFRRMNLETASVLEEAVGLYRNYGFESYRPEHMSRRCDRAYCLNLEEYRNKFPDHRFESQSAAFSITETQ